MSQILFKLIEEAPWRLAEESGAFDGYGIDLTDGFIHLSTREQVAETAALHFAGQPGLLLISVDADALGDQLKWEPSRGGVLFPHVHGQIPMSAVRGVEPLPVGPDGDHQFPWMTA
ncbi:MAG: DUF952 domain-containing protein [Planctomycetota bacterium]